MTTKKIVFFIFLIVNLLTNVHAANNEVEIPEVIAEPITLQPDTSSSALNSIANYSTFSQQQIEQSDAVRISQVLQSAPALQLQDLFGDGSQVAVSLRGFGDNASSNSLILLDGEPLTNPGLNVPDFNLINISDVYKIEVLPGSDSVLYGDQAVGGIVNIITKNPQPNERSATVMFGTFNTQRYRATLSDLFNNGLGYILDANYLTTHNYRDHNNETEKTLNALASYQTDNAQIFLNFDAKDQNLLVPGALTLQQVEQNPQQAENLTDFTNRQTQHLHARFDVNLAENWQLQSSAALRSLTGNGVLGGSPFTEDGNVYLLMNTLNGLINLPHNTLTSISGIDLENGDYALHGVGYFNQATQTKSSLYQQVDLLLLHNVDLIAGGRLATAQNQLDSGTPAITASNQAAVSNLELAWHFSPTGKLFLRRAGNYRFPKTDEDALTLNNQPLKTQTGVSYETGFNWNNDRVSAAVTLYQLNLQNEISFFPDVNSMFFGTNQNLSPTQRTGAIVSGGWWVTRQWQLAGNYSFVDARFNSGIFAGNHIPFVAQNLWNITSDYQWTAYWHFYAEANFVGQRYPGSDVANLAAQLPATTVYNASIRYQRKNYEIACRLNNIFNQRYFAYATAQYSNNSATTFFYPAAGRNVLLTLTANL